MQMTPQERQDYEKLTEEQKEEFDYQSRKHPEWGFQEVMVKLAFEAEADKTINDGGEDVDPNDVNIWMAILKGVKTILSTFKSIGKQIFDVIDEEITFIQEQINSGIREINSAVTHHCFDEVYKFNDHTLQMTDEELQEYDKLSQSEKEAFEYCSRKHPDWNYNQVMTQLVFHEQMKKMNL